VAKATPKFPKYIYIYISLQEICHIATDTFSYSSYNCRCRCLLLVGIGLAINFTLCTSWKLNAIIALLNFYLFSPIFSKGKGKRKSSLSPKTRKLFIEKFHRSTSLSHRRPTCTAEHRRPLLCMFPPSLSLFVLGNWFFVQFLYCSVFNLLILWLWWFWVLSLCVLFSLYERVLMI
jgi:hypothetical protein